jgi:hypothetical protein
VPAHSPLTSFGRKRLLSSSEPCAFSASVAPAVSNGQSAKLILAEFHISTVAAAISPGSP